ncbi:MAG: alpha/beta fold hydrolase [Taibaiella sp.]|nr:alpha/beta fold hydrolase [Taibaiella sp.]
MKNLLLIFLLLMAQVPASAHENTLLTEAVGKFQRFYNSNNSDSVFALFSTRIQGMMPADKTTQMLTQVQASMGNMKGYVYVRTMQAFSYYRVTFDKATVMLVTSLDNGRLDNFRFVADEPEEARQPSNFVLSTATGKVYGTVTVPPGAKKVPVVFLIAGSGPTDRNGNNNIGLRTNAYRMIADSLLKAGIACLRFDKRGVGESAAAMTGEAALSFDDMVADAVGFVQLLKKDARFSYVIIAGHSEGSLVGMIAAQKGGVKKFISIAGAGEPADKTIKDQYLAQSKTKADEVTILLDSLKAGYGVYNVKEDYMSLFRSSIQPYLRSWLKYDPQAEIKKLHIPVLLVQGENDLQVSSANALLLKKAYPAARLTLLPRMNHILKDAPADRSANFATYANPELSLSDGFIAALVRFVK